MRRAAFAAALAVHALPWIGFDNGGHLGIDIETDRMELMLTARARHELFIDLVASGFTHVTHGRMVARRRERGGFGRASTVESKR